MSRLERAGGSGGRRVLLAGTGGQGVILAARLLTEYFAQHGHQVLSSQLHGMAQRGGSVQSSVIVDCGISPAVPRGGADVVVGFEPIETARMLPFMSAKTIVFMNTAPIVPFILSQRFVLGQNEADYPEVAQLEASIRAVAPRLFTLDATALAKEAGSPKTMNVVMLGCVIGSEVIPCAVDDFMSTVMGTAPTGVANVNERAFRSGLAYGRGIRRRLGSVQKT